MGRFDLPGVQRPLQLLEERVMDAWVGSYQPDLPGPDDPDWWVLDLLREPVQLLAAPNHPLAQVRGLSGSDFEPFPSLALPPGWFPRTEAALREQGLWSDPVDQPAVQQLVEHLLQQARLLAARFDDVELVS